jgi:hypothetical protein
LSDKLVKIIIVEFNDPLGATDYIKDLNSNDTINIRVHCLDINKVSIPLNIKDYKGFITFMS